MAQTLIPLDPRPYRAYIMPPFPSLLPTATSSSRDAASAKRSYSSKGGKTTPLVVLWSSLRVCLLQQRRCKASCVFTLIGMIGVGVFVVHRTVALTLTTKSWAPAPINFISRECPAVPYPVADADGKKICMTTLTDQQQADWLQRLLKWRQFDNLLEMTWPNKQAYCEKHGYHLFDSSPYLDNSRPPSWSKIVAARRLLTVEQCDWVVWLDADTVIMNSDKKLEALLPANADFVVTKQKISSYNAGAWIIRNSEWSKAFLDTWWNMDEYVRVKGLSVSGDNDALYHYLTERISESDFSKHIVVPPRCSFNSVTKWVSPSEVKDYDRDPNKVKQEMWYMHEEYYHQGDLIAHVAGRNNKIDTTEELLKHAK